MKRQTTMQKPGRSPTGNNKSGFTLLELIIVMAIIAVLTLIAVPKLLGYSQRAQDTKYIHTAKVIETALEAYLIHGGKFPEDLEVVDSTLLADAAANGKIIGVEGYIASPDNETYYEMSHDFLKKLDVKISADAQNNEFIIEAMADSAPKAIYASTKGKTLLNKDKTLKGYVSGNGGGIGSTEPGEEPGEEEPVDVPINRECTLQVTDAKYLTYEVLGGGKVRVTGLSAEGTSLTELNIPASIDGMDVISIADNAFIGKNITSVCLPESLTSLGISAFYNNANLKKVILNSNLSSIYGSISHPFRGTALNEVILGDAVTSIPESMFYGATGLTSIDLNNVVTINQSAFRNTGLTSVDLKNVTALGFYAFDSSSLKKVTIGKTITTNYVFGKSPFVNTALEEVIIGDEVSSIPDYMFYDNTLTSINLNNVTKVGIRAFFGNNLTSLDLRGVTNVGESAFSENNIAEIDLKNVTSLGDNAFYNNINLKKVTLNKNLLYDYGSTTHPFRGTALNEVILGDAVTSIPEFMFYGATGLTSIDLNNVVTINQSAFRNTGLTSVDSKNVTALGFYAFDSSSLKKVTIGKTITTNYVFGKSPFVNTALEEVIIGDEVSSIPDYMFYDNTLTSINLNNVTKVGIRAFFGNNLTSLDLRGVTNVGESAFSENNIAAIDLKNVTSLGDNAFYNNINLKKVTLNKNLLYDYGSTTHPFRGTALNEVILGDEVTSIPRYMFHGATGLTTIDLNNVAAINQNAFQGTGLTSVDLKNVTAIGANAFDSSSLKKVTIGKTITTNYVFSKSPFVNTALEEVIIGDEVSSIPDYMFYDNTLTSINLNNITKVGIRAFFRNNLTSLDLRSVTNIGESAFSENNIAAIDLKNVTSLGDNAFSSNINLKKVILSINLSNSYISTTHPFRGTSLNEVILGDEVTSIPRYMFHGATGLTTIDLNNVAAINQNAFQGTGLTSVDLKNVTAIGANAFDGSSIKRVIMNKPNTVNYTITQSPFKNTLLDEVVIGDNVVTISDYMFYLNKLTFINLNNVTKVGLAAFYGNRIPQGAAVSNKLASQVVMSSNSFNNNGADGTTTITPIFRSN